MRLHGKIVQRLLEGIGEAPGRLGDFLGAFLEAGYGASRGRLEYLERRYRYQRLKDRAKQDERRRLYQRYYMFMRHLRKQGLIESTGQGLKKIFSLTRKGRLHERILRERMAKALPEPTYAGEKSNTVTIVSFDIPEKVRRKRAWLRSALKNLEFKMVHESFWFGKVKIPKEFINDLLRLRLLHYVEIFEVTKSGTLHQIS